MENVNIYNATYSNIKEKDSVEFEVAEVAEVENLGFLPVKNGKKEHFNIIISDENDDNLTRKEILSFLLEKGILPKNFDRKFPIK